MWTRAALASEARGWSGTIWRVVESQHVVSTMKLVDDLDEQRVLEDIIEASKPRLPAACRTMPYLLAAPFRYAPYPHGSRFRRAGQPDGCFYASMRAETAIAELAFYRVLFFLEAPGMTWPTNALEHTAFAVRARCEAAIDLTVAPFDRDAALWTDPTHYGPCQALADEVRAAEIATVSYRSVRDPGAGLNVAVFAPDALVPPPKSLQTWRLLVRRRTVQAFGPERALEFRTEVWAGDPRIAAALGS